MPWIKVDDHFDEHVKVAAVGPVGIGVWLSGLAYCNRNLTDGFIPHSIAEGIGGAWAVRVPVVREEELDSAFRTVEDDEVVWTIDVGSGMHGERITTGFVIDLLVIHGLWEPVPGGYRVHDYLDYQPSREEVLAERERVRGRVTKHRNTRRNAVTDSVTNGGVTPAPVPVPVPVPNTRDKKGVQQPTSLGIARARMAADAP